MSEIKFTRGDVDLLRMIGESVVLYDRHKLAEEGHAQIASLAKRIESLLPPESPHPEKEI